MNKRIKRLWWAIAGFVEDTACNIKYKIENWNECPVCTGSGENLEDMIDGWELSLSCWFCDGKGKIGILKLVDFWLHRKEYI
jgi:DnaJ-class molecular chaperone